MFMFRIIFALRKYQALNYTCYNTQHIHHTQRMVALDYEVLIQQTNKAHVVYFMCMCMCTCMLDNLFDEYH
jgi:hypothetical protein